MVLKMRIFGYESKDFKLQDKLLKELFGIKINYEFYIFFNSRKIFKMLKFYLIFYKKKKKNLMAHF